MGEIPKGVHPDNPEGRSVYKPCLTFEEDSLIVEFDHALKATPEQIRALDIKAPVTTFFIRPDRELYVGLTYVPQSILTEVAIGLRVQAESEEYTDEQREQIRAGVTRLENFIATGER